MSNLLSNQNIENQIVASNGHNLPTKKVLYEGNVCWAYILYNIRNYKWYVGISTEHPNDYQTSSNNKAKLGQRTSIQTGKKPKVKDVSKI